MWARLLLISLFSVLPFAESLAEAPRLALNTSYTAPITSPDKTGVLDLFYRELFGRLGMEFEIQHLPAERALTNANQGIDDGDVRRIFGLDEKYPDLVRVPEAVAGRSSSGIPPRPIR